MSIMRMTACIRPVRWHDRPEAAMSRQQAGYRCGRGHDSEVTFTAGVKLPQAVDCRCGAPGQPAGPEPDAAPAGWDGVWTHQAEMFAEIGPKYGVISADVLGCFTVMPDDIGTCLEEITCHAGARMRAAGYRGTIWHGKPRTYWYARHLRQDGPAILLAACDLLRNDRRAIADWYLNTLCGGLCELHKPAGGPRACGSDSCIRADETTCVCACGGVNHGIGVSGFPRELLDLDWDSIPVSQIGRTR